VGWGGVDMGSAPPLTSPACPTPASTPGLPHPAHLPPLPQAHLACPFQRTCPHSRKNTWPAPSSTPAQPPCQHSCAGCWQACTRWPGYSACCPAERRACGQEQRASIGTLVTAVPADARDGQVVLRGALPSRAVEGRSRQPPSGKLRRSGLACTGMSWHALHQMFAHVCSPGWSWPSPAG